MCVLKMKFLVSAVQTFYPGQLHRHTHGQTALKLLTTRIRMVTIGKNISCPHRRLMACDTWHIILNPGANETRCSSFLEINHFLQRSLKWQWLTERQDLEYYFTSCHGSEQAFFLCCILRYLAQWENFLVLSSWFQCIWGVETIFWSLR